MSRDWDEVMGVHYHDACRMVRSRMPAWLLRQCDPEDIVMDALLTFLKAGNGAPDPKLLACSSMRMRIDATRAHYRMKLRGDVSPSELDNDLMGCANPVDSQLIADDEADRIVSGRPDRHQIALKSIIAGLSIAESARLAGMSRRRVQALLVVVRERFRREVA